MVATRLRAKFCHRMTRRLGGDGPRQNKQTLNNFVINCLRHLMHSVKLDGLTCFACCPHYAP